jgi:hypothetical protein
MSAPHVPLAFRWQAERLRGPNRYDEEWAWTVSWMSMKRIDQQPGRG